jgi:oligoendopeptidase F
MPTALPARQEVPLEHTWDTASIFPTAADWEAAVNHIMAQLPTLARFRGQLGDGPATLLEWFTASEQIGIALGKVIVYASMNYAVDTTDQAAAAMSDRARGLAARVGAALSFAEPELLAIGFDTLRAWTQSESRLAPYAHYFDQLAKRAAHVRSAEVEEVLALTRDAFMTASQIHGVLANAELKFAPAQSTAHDDTFEVAQGTIGSLLSHTDREVRRTAWEHYADAHLALKNTMASCLATGIKQDVFAMRARRYASSLEASLAPNHIPLDVFHNLIKTFRAHLPTWHRYWRVRRKALGYNTLRVYDTRAPLTATKTPVPFAQAVEWISQGMAPLGAEYVGAMRDGVVEQRWVDIYPNQGKRMGAFSTGSYGTHPFVFMSYNDDLFSLSTLAHELGHSMHSYYTRREQPFVYARYGLFLAEVASNFNQALVRAHLFKTQPDRNFQVNLIEEAMGNFHRYFFVMPTLARFELEIHERTERGQALTADTLIQLMADLFREGYGDEVAMTGDDEARVGITWAQFHTHLYSNFYVYQYATGIAGAHALARGVLAGEPNAAEKYLAFLKSGGSRYPLETLKDAGVDLASPEPVETTFGVMAELVGRLEGLAGKSEE